MNKGMVKGFVVGMVVGAWLFTGMSTRAKQQMTIRAFPIHDKANAVELAAHSLQQQGWDVFDIQPTEDYYPDGDEKTIVWAKGWGEPPQMLEQSNYLPDPYEHCPDYDATTPGLQGPWPGAKPYIDPVTKACGWQ